MSDENKIIKGNRAQGILEDEIFIEAFEAVKERLTRQWIESGTTVDRDEIWKTIKLLEQVIWQLELFMEEATQEKMNKLGEDDAAQVIVFYWLTLMSIIPPAPSRLGL